jgi:hypothetical protein
LHGVMRKLKQRGTSRFWLSFCGTPNVEQRWDTLGECGSVPIFD